MFLSLLVIAGARAQAQDATPVPTIIHKSFIEYKADLKWGGAGTAQGKFKAPVGLCVDPSDHVFVNDNGNKRVEKFDGEGKFMASYEGFEKINDISSEFDLGGVKGIQVDKDGNFYFSGSLQMVGFNTDKKVIFNNSTGGNWMAGFFLSRDGYLYDAYSADGGGGNIYKRNRAGKELAEYPSKAARPNAIAVDGKGNIYVANWIPGGDMTDYGVQKYSPSGDFVATWSGKYGSKDGQFETPACAAVDAEDHLFVLDSQADRVQVFNGDGRLWTKFGHKGIGLGEMRNPSALGVNSKGQVFVLDTGNNRVERFTRYRVDLTLDGNNKVLERKETPLTGTLSNSGANYSQDSQGETNSAGENASHNGGLADTVQQKGKDAVGNAVGDVGRKLGF
jgi:sugar lactone lactonase YvrE